MIELSVPVTTHTKIQLSEDQSLYVTLKYLKSKINHYKMEFIKEVKGKSTWYYDDPDHRHGSIQEYEFREATERELLFYKTYHKLKDENI